MFKTMEFLEHLAKAIERTGHTISMEETFFTVEPINLKIEAETGERNEHNVNGQFSVVYEVSVTVRHDNLFPDGIWDCLAGIGGNDEEALTYAAQVWTEGVFLTIHEILVPTETKDFQVPRFDMLTKNQETGEEFGWKLYLGAFQTAGEYATRSDLDDTILAQKLLNAISSVTTEKKLIWIKTYIAKLSASGAADIQADCLLNNQNWNDGLNALYWFAEEWTDVKSFASMKQFIIIKPCEISEIENAEKIRQELPPMEKKGFFRKWFGK